MREIIRRELITLKYHPVLIPFRLAFYFLVVVLCSAQWGLMMIGFSISVGFIFSTEMEAMIPLSEREMMELRYNRVRYCFIRYTIIGLISLIINIVGISGLKRYGVPGYNLMAPGFKIVFFILQMTVIYTGMVSIVDPDDSKDKKNGKAVGRTILESVPNFIMIVIGLMITGFSARIGIAKAKENMPFISGNRLKAVIIILLAAIFIGIVNIVRRKRNYRKLEFEPDGKI